MSNQEITELKSKMEEVLNFYGSELNKVRTGRANSAMIEDFKVPYYGSQVALKTIASIGIPEANLITIQPWDTGVISEIENSIRNSDLGYNVSSDGRIIRLTIPPMTAERREELIKIIQKISEENKIKLRNLRREVWDSIQSREKSSQISEDEKYTAQKELQDLIVEYEKKIDSELAKKEIDIKHI